MYAHEHVHMSTKVSIERSEEVIRAPGTRLTGDCELSIDINAGNPTRSSTNAMCTLDY